MIEKIGKIYLNRNFSWDIPSIPRCINTLPPVRSAIRNPYVLLHSLLVRNITSSYFILNFQSILSHCDTFCKQIVIRSVYNFRMPMIWYCKEVFQMLAGMLEKNAYRIFLGKPGRRRPLGRPRIRWKDDIRMDFEKYYGDGFIWLGIGTNGGLLWTR
jgi:hypothetical protein